MADTKTTALTEVTAPIATDILYMVVDPGVTPLSRKVQFANLMKAAQNQYFMAAATELTVAAGVITVTQSAHKLQPASGTADDLDTISGTAEGEYFLLYVTDEGTDTITLKHGTGNLSCSGGYDITLSEGMVVCYSDSTTVYVTGSGDAPMVKITETKLTGSATTIDFSDIPQTYKHLKLIGSVRTDLAATLDSLLMRINNNSTADDYAFQNMSAVAATIGAAEYVTDETSAVVALTTGASASAGYFGTFDVILSDYANANKSPTFISSCFAMTGVATGNLYFRHYAGLLDVSGAVTRLTFFPDGGTNLVEHSIISLYGIR